MTFCILLSAIKRLFVDADAPSHKRKVTNTFLYIDNSFVNRSATFETVDDL